MPLTPKQKLWFENVSHLAITLLFGGLVAFAFWCQWNSMIFFGSIVVIDAYVVAVLFAAALRADAQKGSFDTDKTRLKNKDCMDFLKWLFPTRTVGLFMVMMFFAVLVISFAGLYQESPSDFYCSSQPAQSIGDPSNACYFSLVTICTVGYGDFAPVAAHAKHLVMGEIASGILLLVCAISFLISRIAAFE